MSPPSSSFDPVRALLLAVVATWLPACTPEARSTPESPPAAPAAAAPASSAEPSVAAPPSGPAAEPSPAESAPPAEPAPPAQGTSEGDGYQKCPAERSQMCTRIYRPVCADVDTGIRCVRAPCPSVEKKTYPSDCTACADAKVIGHRPGPCPEPAPADPPKPPPAPAVSE